MVNFLCSAVGGKKGDKPTLSACTVVGHLKPILSIRNIIADAWVGISMATTDSLLINLILF